MIFFYRRDGLNLTSITFIVPLSEVDNKVFYSVAVCSIDSLDSIQAPARLGDEKSRNERSF
jgi:hypothetical protein